MSNLVAPAVGSLTLLLSAIGLSQALTDPYGIAPVVGVALRDSAAFECTSTESRNLDGTPRRSHICVSRVGEGARRVPVSNWSLTFDSTGRVYSGQHVWRDNASATAVRRDSVATAIGMRGAQHIVCPDSLDQSKAHPVWLSVWRGQTYNVLLYHYQSDDNWVLSLQVSPGVYGICYNRK